MMYRRACLEVHDVSQLQREFEDVFGDTIDLKYRVADVGELLEEHTFLSHALRKPFSWCGLG